MKPQQKIKKVGASVASDLRNFSDVLARFDIFVDVSKAINTLKEDLTYHISESSFSIEGKTMRHLRPEGIKKLTITVSSICKVLADTWDSKELDNRFETLGFTVKLYSEGNCQTGFHIDLTQPHELESIFPHPTYHLQFAPAMDFEDDFDYQMLLTADAPRIPHPPVDFILGLDYILHNFDPKKRDKLIQDGTYSNLITKYQEKIWKPYYQQIASHWEGTNTQFDNNNLWHPQNLLPHLQ
jgi:hypothetical protein